MAKKRSKILEAIRSTARDLHAFGSIDRITMREFDQLRLPAVPQLRPAQIKRIREMEKVSQAVFAAMLNTSLSTVQKWEIGTKRPHGAALKLLHVVQKNGLDAIV